MAKLESGITTLKEQHQSPRINVKLLQKYHKRYQLTNGGLVLIQNQEIVSPQDGPEKVDSVLCNNNNNSTAKNSVSKVFMEENLFDSVCERIIDSNMEFEQYICSILTELIIAKNMTPHDEADALVSNHR